MKTYGRLTFDREGKVWYFTELQPHVIIKMKNLFPSIPKNLSTIFFHHKLDTVMDLYWFIQRYPMKMKRSHRRYLKFSREKFQKRVEKLERLLAPNYKPSKQLSVGDITLRDYQIQFVNMAWMVKRMVLGDETGIGKTFQSLALASNKKCLPMLCVVQTHLPDQWKDNIDKIFPDCKYHYINKTKPYSLPPADIYVTKYSMLHGWFDYWPLSGIKTVVFDEIQELRSAGSLKYLSARRLSHEVVDYSIGLSATPIFNYGDDAYTIFDLVKQGCLGAREDFNREWMDFSTRKVKDTQALGSYLIEQNLFLRRTREQVGRELPPVNRIPHYIETDHKELEKVEDLARSLAMKSLRGPALDMGTARRELDIMMRHATGVAKAKGVAQYVRMFLENGEKVVLAGWHRDVYDIWLRELKEFNPAMYTGSEGAGKGKGSKKESLRRFCEDETDLFIISLKSGAGIDVLQNHCSVIIFGELAWSPQIHKQLIDRLNRDRADGTKNNVTAIFLLSNEGSDPVIVDLLGIKDAQSHGILNPFSEQAPTTHTDETRLERLARSILEKKGIAV